LKPCTGRTPVLFPSELGSISVGDDEAEDCNASSNDKRLDQNTGEKDAKLEHEWVIVVIRSRRGRGLARFLTSFEIYRECRFASIISSRVDRSGLSRAGECIYGFEQRTLSEFIPAK